MPGGGIIPARIFRITGSQVSGWSPTELISADWSDKLAVFSLSL